jgi:hypothetical protein
MPKNDHIVGSAEPLSPEETRKRLQELAEWGVDLSLVEASLRRTPTERIQHMVGLLRVIEELKRGYTRAIAEREQGLVQPSDEGHDGQSSSDG